MNRGSLRSLENLFRGLSCLFAIFVIGASTLLCTGHYLIGGLIFLSAIVGVFAVSKKMVFWWPRKRGSRPRVLMFHAVSDDVKTDTAPNNTLRPDTLRLLIQDLLASGYTFQTLHEAFETPNNKKRVVVLTFDDGYVDNYTTLLPILREFQVKATVFITDIRTEEYLSDAQIMEMHASGLIEFGGHTQNHVNLAACEDATARQEIEKNYDSIKRLLGYSPTSFAYPFGKYTTRDRDLLEEIGYRFAVTTKKKFFTADLLQIERQIIPRKASRFMAYLLATRGKCNI